MTVSRNAKWLALGVVLAAAASIGSLAAAPAPRAATTDADPRSTSFGDARSRASHELPALRAPQPVPVLPAAREDRVRARAPLPPRAVEGVDDLRAAEPELVRLRPDQVLARVDGVPVSLRDLVAIPKGAGEVERTMPREELEARRHAAIDRELTFQEARRRGLDVDGEVESQRERLAAGNLEALEAFVPSTLFWTTVTDAHVALEACELAAVSLQQRLLEGEVGPIGRGGGPLTIPETEAWRGMLARLRAGARIEIVDR